MNETLSAPLVVLALAFVSGGGPVRAVEFTREFAPLRRVGAEIEEPLREEVCLNGRWQFQPVPGPDGWMSGTN